DVTAAKTSERQRGMLVEELNHRVKNILSVAMSIASQMLRNFSSVESFREAYFARLQALAKANELMAQRNWVGARLRDVVELEVALYMEKKKSTVKMDGPNVSLLPRAALTLGLVFHELVTNAAKHGALAKSGMKLAVTWDLESASETQLVIRWEETGGRGIK